MNLTRIAGAAAVLLSGVYFYFFFRRIAELAGLRTETFEVRLVLAALALVFVLPALDVWGFWAVVVLHLGAFALLTDLADWLLRRAGRAGKRWRFWYRSGLIPAAALAAVLAYGWWNMHHIVRTGYEIATEKAVREKGWRIALLSDLHYGVTMDAADLEACCRRVGRERPDAVVLCGDIVDETTSKEEMEEAFRLLSGIRAEFGIYYVYGNHDNGTYRKTRAYTAGELKSTIQESGIRILQDEAVSLLGEVTLIGRDDYRRPRGGSRASSEKLAEEADPEQFLILLDHQPRDLEKNASCGFDLQLSGHTHGGQIWPVGVLDRRFGELNYGYKKIGAFQAVVTSGLAGGNYPLRTGKHSEYVILDILPAAGLTE